MLLESNFKSYDSTRRKAYNVDNPVQAKRSSGFRDTTPTRSTPKRVELLRSSEGQSVIFLPRAALRLHEVINM